jgi:hypothetical protein
MVWGIAIPVVMVGVWSSPQDAIIAQIKMSG